MSQVAKQTKVGYQLGIIVFILATVFLGVSEVHAVTYTQIGNTTFGSDGTSYSKIGNTLFGSNGTSYTKIGNTTFGSNGSSYTQIGNSLFGNNGTSYTRIGSSIFGSDGSVSTKIGNTTFGNGGVFNTCPANSSYDSLSGKCKCNYGYAVSGSSCIYDTSSYNSYSNYSASAATSICPANSSRTAKGCTCSSGYVASGNKCITETQNCQTAYGIHSYGNGGYCYCSTGHQFNSLKTLCIQSPVAGVASQTANASTGTYTPTIADLQIQLAALKAQLAELLAKKTD